MKDVPSKASKVSAGGESIAEPSPGAVIKWVVSSLYKDEACPRGPLLQWMLQLLVGVKLSHRQIRTCIDAAPGVYADPPESKKLNFTALLDVPPPGFTGFVSEQDASAEALGEDVWQEVVRVCAKGGWPKPEDVAHRHYVVASWMQDASDRLRQLSFGRVLSIVRSSLSTSNSSTAGLLGNRGGFLVPYALSEECERRVNAVTGQPTHVAPDEAYVKTWDELRDLLRRLIKGSPDKQVEVCQLKATIRQQFQTELSETVFGHQTLSKLLGDAQLGDEFMLTSPPAGNRYMLAFNSQQQAAASTLFKAASEAAADSAGGTLPKEGGRSRNSAAAPAASRRNPPGLQPPRPVALKLAQKLTTIV